MLGTAWGSQVERGSLVTRDGLCIRVQERSLLGGSEAVRHVGLFDRRVAEKEVVCDCYQRVWISCVEGQHYPCIKGRLIQG